MEKEEENRHNAATLKGVLDGLVSAKTGHQQEAGDCSPLSALVLRSCMVDVLAIVVEELWKKLSFVAARGVRCDGSFLISGHGSVLFLVRGKI